jgi:hypothetical protein
MQELHFQTNSAPGRAHGHAGARAGAGIVLAITDTLRSRRNHC